MSQTIRVSAPSRLHFGLLRFASEQGRSYGGLGMMIDRPRVSLELSPADRWECFGPCAERALQFARQAAEAFSDLKQAPLSVRVLSVLPSHTGLGSGTQLALATAAGVHRLLGEGEYRLEELVKAAGRGGRGAVGSHGFQQGGLIWELGKLPEQKLGQLQQRLAVPDTWRIMLITIPHSEGLSGEVESQAFRSLPPVPEETTRELIRLAEQCILPAVEAEDFQSFSAALYEYGVLAGNCFAPIQKGPFVTPKVAEVVRQVRHAGLAGTGQSSWGPTVFAFAENDASATELIKRLQKIESLAGAQFEIARPDNCGAQVNEITEDLQQPVVHQGLVE